MGYFAILGICWAVGVAAVALYFLEQILKGRDANKIRLVSE